MQIAQQAANYLNLKLTWEVIKSQTAPIDQDYALHAIGKTIIERNADVYQEALLYAGILCDMVTNITAASTPLSSDIHTKYLYLHLEENESLGQNLLDLLHQVDLRKKDAFVRSKSRAQRFNGVAEAYQKHERFKSSKAVQRILSSKVAKGEGEHSVRKQLTYADAALFRQRTAAAGADTKTTDGRSGSALGVYNSHHQPTAPEPQLSESGPAGDADSCCSGSSNTEEDDFYAVDPIVPKRPETKTQSAATRPASSIPTEQIIKPKIYDNSISDYAKLVAADFTESFVAKIRGLLEAEYRDLLAKIEKMQSIIANMTKVNDMALSISQELLESAHKLTAEDILNLKNQLLMQASSMDAPAKSAKAPLLLKSPTQGAGNSGIAPLSLTGSMSTFKCLPKIGSNDA